MKFIAPFKIIYRNGKDSLKNVFYFTLLYPRKNDLRRKSKVCPLDTQIKYSGLRISHSKVFSSNQVYLKFGDGDEPNLSRVNKVDVSSTFY